jgi:hypothetical protein
MYYILFSGCCFFEVIVAGGTIGGRCFSDYIKRPGRAEAGNTTKCEMFQLLEKILSLLGWCTDNLLQPQLDLKLRKWEPISTFAQSHN